MELERILRAERAGKATITNIGTIYPNTLEFGETGYQVSRVIFDPDTGEQTSSVAATLTISLLDNEITMCQTSLVAIRAKKNALIALRDKLLLI